MEGSKWQEGRERRRQKALEEHARLHNLYVEDRFAFERETKRMIDEHINSAEDEHRRERMRTLQDLWDKKMKHAESAHNRFVLAQTFFWDQFFKRWYPTIEKLNVALNGRSDHTGSKPRPRLIK